LTSEISRQNIDIFGGCDGNQNILDNGEIKSPVLEGLLGTL